MTRSLIKDGEIAEFSASLRDFQQGRLDADKFTAIRLQHGVYGQRQDNVFMLRIKVPGGSLRADQLVATADVLDNYSQDTLACVTTRQDFQLHFVPLENVVPAMERLAEVGLTTREACGNAVRNNTGCSLAGVCPREHTDIGVHLHDVTTHFLRHPLTQHMPRKFKMSFSGCESDCAQGMMHDLGVVASERDGAFGFKILAGGGLGHKPRQAIVIEEFLPEADLIPAIEAVITLHHRYSDRTKRARSRIKFLVDRFGAEEFTAKYRAEFARTREALADRQPARGEWQRGDVTATIPGIGAPRQSIAQKQAGKVVLPVSLHLGDMTSPQLRGLADIMTREGLSDVRTTQDQNIMLLGVDDSRLSEITASLATYGLGLPKTGDDVVACPGTWTCRLGITSSRTAAPKLSGGIHDLQIRVSSCHNGCAQPYVGDIGLHGEGRRLFGKLIPHYRLHLGGNGQSHGALAVLGPEVPSARIQYAVERITARFETEKAADENFFAWSRRKGTEYFKELLADISHVEEQQLHEVIKDHGESEAFRVLQLGGGECAAVSQEFVAAALADARHEREFRRTFFLRQKFEDALDCAEAVLRYTAKSLAFVSKQGDAEELVDLIAKLQQAEQVNPAIVQQLQALWQELGELRQVFDGDNFVTFTRAQDAWFEQATQHANELESRPALGVALNLNLSL